MAIEARDFDPNKTKLPPLTQAYDDTFDTIYEPGTVSSLNEPLPREKVLFDRVVYESKILPKKGLS